MSNILKKVLPVIIVFNSALFASAQYKPITKESFAIINLNYPGLEKVKNLVNTGKYQDAGAELLAYYRNRHTVKHLDYNIGDSAKYANKKLPKATIEIADNSLLHKFKPHKSYPYFNYGKDIDWQLSPVQDKLIRTFLHRTTWWEYIGQAYWTTGNEKYAKEFVYELDDWVKKNRLGAYPDDTAYAWKAFVVSFRLKTWSGCFNMFVNSKAFTPSFLMEFLNSYAQQAGYVKANYTDIGNHRLFESLHMLYAGTTFPEVKNAIEWRKSGIKVLNEEITKQVYPDGMQWELSTTYHIGSIHIFMDALRIAQLAGIENEFPSSYRNLIEKMVLAVVNFSFPDYTFPLYGDSFATKKSLMLENYKNWQQAFPQNKVIQYFATDGKKGNVPAYLSKALPNAGFYAFRNGWNANSTVMQLKAGPPAAFHAQPDNGTFELWVKGRNFTPDAGSYTYNDTSKINNKRDWYCSTRVHQTLTLDNKNMVITKARLNKWDTSPLLDILSYTNPSYPGLDHQRTVLFIDKTFFVIIDRAIGNATGNLGIHFALKEDSKPTFNKQTNTVTTTYADGNNLLIQSLNSDNITLTEEKSFVSYEYQHEISRPAFVFEKPKPNNKTQAFISIVYPFSGTKKPAITMIDNVGNNVANGQVNLTININGKPYRVVQKL